MCLRQSLSHVEWGSVGLLDGPPGESPKCSQKNFLSSTSVATIGIECQLRIKGSY